jgi:hypothetical protein
MKELQNASLSVTNRGTFFVSSEAPGKILKNTGGEDVTKFPVISMPAFREILRNASTTARNK